MDLRVSHFRDYPPLSLKITDSEKHPLDLRGQMSYIKVFRDTNMFSFPGISHVFGHFSEIQLLFLHATTLFTIVISAALEMLKGIKLFK